VCFQYLFGGTSRHIPEQRQVTMADEQQPQDSTLNKVARTVGSALGTVASTVSNLTGDEAQQAGTKSGQSTKGKQQPTASAKPMDERARRRHEKLKEKRAKHRRRMHNKARG
jgi:hypothetical protein